MQHFCDKRAAKNNNTHIWQQVNILAIHVTVWFFKLFLMYPLSLQELGSDNTAYLDFFTILLSLIVYGHQLKEVKNCHNYNASRTFTYHFISLKRKQPFFLVPHHYGLSLLWTLNFLPEGVRNNGSRLQLVSCSRFVILNASILYCSFYTFKVPSCIYCWTVTQ